MSLELGEFIEFIQKDGAVGLMVEIELEKGSLFGEIEERVHVSQTTLSNRLDEARGMGLIGETRLPEDHGNAKRYILGPEGEFYRAKMKEFGLDDAYERLLEARQDIDDGMQNLTEMDEEFDQSKMQEIIYAQLGDDTE